MAGATPSITSILPDEGWAPLLEIIVREAPSASVIEVNTAGMQALAERMLGEVDRQDVTVELRACAVPWSTASSPVSSSPGHRRTSTTPAGGMNERAKLT